MPFRAKTELRSDQKPLTAKTDKPLSRRKWTRKSTIRGIVVLTEATPLPQHQPQKSIHFPWYRREVDVLMQPDISRVDPSEKPYFWRIRWRVTKLKVQRVDALVEAVEVGLLQQPAPPRQHERWLGQQKEKVDEPLLLRPEKGDQSHGEIGVSLTLASTLPTRGKAETPTSPGCPKDAETHPRRPPGNLG